MVTDEAVTGVIDFEDVVSTIRIGELSVACAYAMLLQADPISVAMDVIRGYRQIASVTRLEATHLYSLTLARLAVSVCVAAGQPPDCVAYRTKLHLARSGGEHRDVALPGKLLD